jgi:TRAP-type C4-dicarboxylate transport system substrate-binding protein
MANMVTRSKLALVLAALVLAALVRAALALTALALSTTARAEPTTLKLWFYTAESSTSYQCHVKPFVEAINNDSAQIVRIDVTFNPAIRPLEDQFKPIMGGDFDITIVTPGYVPARFKDTEVLQLPGLFHDQLESIRAYEALVDANELPGYQDLYVLGAFLSLGESIHSRKPTAQLADLRGQNIRVNNEIEAATLRKFGANPVFLPITQTMDGLGKGTVDGVAIPTPAILDFGIGRMTTNQYLLPTGPVPTILTMMRARFSTLSPAAQANIRKHAGAEFAQHAAACMLARDREVTARLQADTRRKVTVPSAADRAEADQVFAQVTREWAAQRPRNQELLNLVKAEITKARAGK